ncbi:class I SAM-dependent methyltransferase [soil metagenome]
MKDNFSLQSKDYANFRPRYPEALYDFLYSNLHSFERALDVATGNGQVATELAKKFTTVYATDISKKQLAEAPQLSNVFYKAEAAEDASFPDHYFDLITVAQAIHWFDFDKFYTGVKRMLKPGGMVAVIGYGLISVNERVDLWLHHFYKNITGPYWDKERKYIDALYTTIPFPLTEITVPNLQITYSWSREQFIGYINTWSAVQHFIKATKSHPLSAHLMQRLNLLWPDDVLHKISFPLLLRTGHI